MAGSTSYYDFMRSGRVNMKELIGVANTATLDSKEYLPEYVKMLKNNFAPVRYWGATGCTTKPT